MKKIMNRCIALAAASLLASPVLSQTPTTRQTEKRPEAQKEKSERAKPEPSTPVRTAKTAPALTPEQRDIAKKAAHFESVHRDRTARMNQLIRIYKAKGDEAKVQKLEEMKAKEEKRTANAMAGFRQRLGDENWGRLNAEMKRHHGRDEHQKEKSQKEKSR